MTNRLTAFVLLALAAAPLLADQQQVLSNVYPIVKKYKSMEGPQGMQTVYLGDRSKPELLWLTAIRTEVVGADGKTAMSSDLMCHMNVDIDPARHKALFNLKREPAARLMTLSQGMRVAGGAFEAKLPDGFAFPIASNEPLYVMTQVLNQNIEHPKNLNVRHRVTFVFTRDRDLKQRPVALFNVGMSGTVLMADEKIALPGMPADHSGPSCLIGQRATNEHGSMSNDYVDPQGRHLTGHWVVPPGRQVNASDVTWFMNLPYDAKLHYAAVHLHPYAESLTLRDTTTGKDIFEAHAKNPKSRIGLDRVDSFVSLAGVPIYKDHKYELISVYNNPTKQNADSMASMFLGLADPEFAVPTTAELVDRGTVLSDNSAIVMRTTSGDFVAMMTNGATSLQVAKLLGAGAFHDAAATVSDSGITFTSKATIPELTNAASQEQIPGTVALCRGAGEVSVVVVTRKSTLDAQCSVFAQIGPGSDVVRSMIETGSGRLIRADVLNGPDMNDLHLAPAKKIAAK